MNEVKDEDLILLYYGEHDDPELAARVARTPELSARLDRLIGLFERVDELPVPEPGPDFGARIWRLIVPRLEPSQPRWRAALATLLAPRLSLAGAAALIVVAMAAFWLGTRSHPGAQIDSQRLLAGQVSAHLGRADLLLTEYVNGPGNASEAAWAAELLMPNRLYRRAATAAGHARLARLLGEMETLLIELANDSGQNPDGSRRLKDQVDDGLLFQVRVMQDQLARKPDQA